MFIFQEQLVRAEEGVPGTCYSVIAFAYQDFYTKESKDSKLFLAVLFTVVLHKALDVKY